MVEMSKVSGQLNFFGFHLSKISFTILVLGLAFLSLLYFQREEVLRESIKEKFINDANEITAGITSNKKIREEALIGIGQFFSSSLNVNQWEFKNYTSIIIENLEVLAICYFGADGRNYESTSSKGKICGKFANDTSSSFDTTTSDLILHGDVRSADGTEGHLIMVVPFSTLLPNDKIIKGDSEFRVNLDAGNRNVSEEYYFFRDKNVFVKDGETSFYITVMNPIQISTLSFSFDYVLVLLLYSALLVLSVYTVETGLRREYLISMKVHRQEIAIKRQYEELAKQKMIVSRNERLASIGLLAAGIGHEINNPLTIILGYLNSVRKGLLQRDYAEVSSKVLKIESAAFRIEKIVSGLRKLSRQERQEQTERFYVKDVFDETISMLKDLYEKNGIEITMNLSLDDRVIIEGDRVKFQQIIVNLISNAKDAVEGKKHGLINIDVRQFKDFIDVSVKDNGIGMTKEQSESVFDLFYTTKDVGKGTGIGLSLVYGFVKDEFKGNIFVESVKDKGTSFKLVLPVKEGEINETVSDNVVNLYKEKQLRCHVLIVDDEEGIRDLMREMLEDQGISVSLAKDGKEAMEYYLNDPDSIDIVISDLKMPIMDGPTLVRNIRKQNTLKQPKLILSTGCVNLQTERGGNIESLLDGVLYKPFSEERLMELISNVLNDIEDKKLVA